AVRIFLARAHALQDALHRPAHAAAPAHEAAHAAMHLDHELARVAGELVQLVDVLRDERMELALALELDQREMAGVRLRVPRGMLQPALPRGFAHLGIVEVVVDVGELLGERILGPHALRPAEVGNARVGGDAGARENDNAPRDFYPAAHLALHQSICILPPPPAPPSGGNGPCGTTIWEAAWRRRSCSS